MKKIAVRLSLNTFSSLEFYYNLEIPDLLEIAEEVKAVTNNNG